ncbi:hypothetical protein P4637_07820 [Halalkalibacterium halodurans]|uniref:BH1471 protein n=2 Tax=Halalkalibacterium halodurans TaxID=86665 RepID=Q9KCU8_HALH5|nr:hypothetical protein [Halalkalibacterium halodurans]MDY7221992.1 hypothetical protein [Halalkalibacterium halodurans]MDY7241268.1 hypothetical protein [Halalkalibacterium halodurans]MED3646919.1 hypothetical protein [Halalkalibacterium halodurans]MED4082883.1 hypothetical protein [Halalkalibacterium halodurans]MED4084769.1 hypothetical protein [Halalkalibacterium halodurans]
MRKRQLMPHEEYTNLFKKVILVNEWYKQKYIKTPTIAEIAMMVGDSEEKVLECLEFGNPMHANAFPVH